MRHLRRLVGDAQNDARICWARGPRRVSCVLRAIGTAFDVDAYLRDSPLVATAVFRRGEARASGQPNGPQWAASGLNIAVSDADGQNLDAQVSDALRFLREHEDELRRLGSSSGMEEMCLDFSVERRDVIAQSEIFPAELLWQAGALDIDLVVTHYRLPQGQS